jgi:hypothetical protein
LCSVAIYILCFIAFIIPQTRTIKIPDITPSLFNQLRLEYGETLSCPCSTTAVSYKIFVSNTISFHPVCSSVFVSQQWIEALYLAYASEFLVMDFRTTASAQVSESRFSTVLKTGLILLSNSSMNVILTMKENMPIRSNSDK